MWQTHCCFLRKCLPGTPVWTTLVLFGSHSSSENSVPWTSGRLRLKLDGRRAFSGTTVALRWAAGHVLPIWSQSGTELCAQGVRVCKTNNVYSVVETIPRFRFLCFVRLSAYHLFIYWFTSPSRPATVTAWQWRIQWPLAHSMAPAEFPLTGTSVFTHNFCTISANANTAKKANDIFTLLYKLFWLLGHSERVSGTPRGLRTTLGEL